MKRSLGLALAATFSGLALVGLCLAAMLGWYTVIDMGMDSVVYIGARNETMGARCYAEYNLEDGVSGRCNRVGPGPATPQGRP